MNISQPARALIRSWAGYARGEKMKVDLTDNDHILAEYASEELGKKYVEKVVAQFFAMGGKKDFETLVCFCGVRIDRQDKRRVAAEKLYAQLCNDLFIADWPRPSAKFLTEELYGCAEAMLPVAQHAIDQSVKYNGRNWRYFKVVAEQAATTQVAEDSMEQEELEGMKLPDDYFEQLRQNTVNAEKVNAERAAFHGDIQSKIEDNMMEKKNAPQED